MIRIQTSIICLSFQILKEQGYSNVATEEFENTADLLSAILVRHFNSNKRGLSEYVEISFKWASWKNRCTVPSRNGLSYPTTTCATMMNFLLIRIKPDFQDNSRTFDEI